MARLLHRTLARMSKKPKLIGLLPAQNSTIIPRRAHDVPLDAIVTEDVFVTSPFRMRLLFLGDVWAVRPMPLPSVCQALSIATSSTSSSSMAKMPAMDAGSPSRISRGCAMPAPIS